MRTLYIKTRYTIYGGQWIWSDFEQYIVNFRYTDHEPNNCKKKRVYQNITPFCHLRECENPLYHPYIAFCWRPLDQLRPQNRPEVCSILLELHCTKGQLCDHSRKLVNVYLSDGLFRTPVVGGDFLLMSPVHVSERGLKCLRNLFLQSFSDTIENIYKPLDRLDIFRGHN